MVTALTPRRAGLDDVEALVRLRLALLREIGELQPGDDEPALAEAIRRYLAGALPGEACAGWVVTDGARIVAGGLLVFFYRPPSARNPAGVEAYVLSMYTEPAWRSRGLATAILRAMLGFAREGAARRIWLHATPEGRPVYERAGFVAGASDMELVW